MRVFEIPEDLKRQKVVRYKTWSTSNKMIRSWHLFVHRTWRWRIYQFSLCHYGYKKDQVEDIFRQYSRPRSNGINAITIKEGDVLLEAKLTTGQSQVVLAVRSGKAIRFEENKTRPMGRNASGVRGIRLADDKDEVIGMISVNDMDSDILVVSENGYGKRQSWKIIEWQIVVKRC